MLEPGRNPSIPCCIIVQARWVGLGANRWTTCQWKGRPVSSGGRQSRAQSRASFLVGCRIGRVGRKGEDPGNDEVPGSKLLSSQLLSSLFPLSNLCQNQMDLSIPQLPRRNVEVFEAKNGSVIAGIPFLCFFSRNSVDRQCRLLAIWHSPMGRLLQILDVIYFHQQHGLAGISI